ncbi:Endochitinase B1 [Penicillium canescens]|uniref:Endochitinase B1 n=1 Tax=Penicillium canescens TaxID=5083 RepID=UPI0026DF7B43|nr:Endochitinase B1 [Penicillium canescens]KAJ6039350.1 Endochitinase B1 [Penicillium canescens]
MKAVAYFGNWDIYGANYFITDVPAENLTHLVYVFANVNTTTGSVILSDTWADLQYAYPGDNTTAPGENVCGNIKQMFLLKKKHRHLKTMLSIDHSQAAQMVDLLKRLRQSLDQLAEKTDHDPVSRFLHCYGFGLHGTRIQQLLWLLVKLVPGCPQSTCNYYDTNSSLDFYMFNGRVPPNKIVLENPLYGRVFNGTNGVGDKFSNGGTQGSLAALKAEYVQCLGLAGTAWWEVSMDRNDTLSLIGTTVSLFGGAGALDQSLHNLNYPTSTYVNLKDGFSGN